MKCRLGSKLIVFADKDDVGDVILNFDHKCREGKKILAVSDRNHICLIRDDIVENKLSEGARTDIPETIFIIHQNDDGVRDRSTGRVDHAACNDDVVAGGSEKGN